MGADGGWAGELADDDTGEAHDFRWWDEQGERVDFDTDPLCTTRTGEHAVNVPPAPIQLSPSIAPCHAAGSNYMWFWVP